MRLKGRKLAEAIAKEWFTVLWQVVDLVAPTPVKLAPVVTGAAGSLINCSPL